MYSKMFVNTKFNNEADLMLYLWTHTHSIKLIIYILQFSLFYFGFQIFLQVFEKLRPKAYGHNAY